MLQGLEPVPMHALLLERADHALDQTVLLWTMRRDELLAQPVAPDQGREAAAGEDQPIARTQQARPASYRLCGGAPSGAPVIGRIGAMTGRYRDELHATGASPDEPGHPNLSAPARMARMGTRRHRGEAAAATGRLGTPFAGRR